MSNKYIEDLSPQEWDIVIEKLDDLDILLRDIRDDVISWECTGIRVSGPMYVPGSVRVETASWGEVPVPTQMEEMDIDTVVCEILSAMGAGYGLIRIAYRVTDTGSEYVLTIFPIQPPDGDSEKYRPIVVGNVPTVFTLDPLSIVGDDACEVLPSQIGSHVWDIASGRWVSRTSVGSGTHTGK